MPALDIDSVEKRYRGGTLALAGISLAVNPGLFGLLGPNGAGKSTLMRTLATLQGVDQGSITFKGIDLLKHPERIRPVLGYLPQDFGFHPELSAEAMLTQIAVLKGFHDRSARRKRVREVLEQVNLGEHRADRVGTFSGGMRQRLGIAQALLGHPALLIVDEPTAGLDPAERRRFHNLLGGVAEDVVVLVSTHIVEDVAEICSDLAIMLGGRVVASGTPDSLVATLEGRIWEGRFARNDAGAYLAPDGSLRAPFEDVILLSAQYVGSSIKVRVAAPHPPGTGFSPTAATLEDAYFLATLRMPTVAA